MTEAAKKQPKAKKPKKEKKAPGPKLAANNDAPGRVGHNSGEAIPALVELMDETLGIDEQIKALNKAKRDIRNRAKTEFGVLSWNWSAEIAMRKVDKDVRIQRESGAVDLKNMLGYQVALDLQPTTTARTEDELADPSQSRDAEVNRR